MGVLDLHHQFLISSDQNRRPPGWNEYRLDGHFVHSHPKLPVAPVLDSDKQIIGFILGWAIADDGKLALTEQQWPISSPHSDDDAIENMIYRYGGRFAVLLATGTVKRVYLDPAGSLSMVYGQREAVAGSTVTTLAMSNPDHPVWHGRPSLAPVRRPNRFLPGALTIDPHVSQLLPNHYLDLNTWQAVRHYPKEPSKAISRGELEESYRRILEILRRQLAALAAAYSPFYITLTAGQDSRLMLAGARDLCDRVDFVTFDKRVQSKRVIGHILDVDVACNIAQRFQLRHQMVSSGEMSSDVWTDYSRRIGYSGGSGKARYFFAAAKQHLNMNGGIALGHAGPVRRTYWRGIASNRESLSANKLLIRMGLPQDERSRLAMDHWLKNFPPFPTTTILDSLYIEQRLGCWAAPHYYGIAPFSAILSPFVHRELLSIVDAINRTDTSQGNLEGIAAQSWPELLEFPVNGFKGFDGWRMRPRRAYQTFRKRMSGYLRRR